MRAEVADAEAAAALAQAALAAAQSNLEHTSIVSPIAGTVIARNVAVGQSVVAAQTEPLFRVAADPGTLKINVTAEQRVADALRLGDALLVSLETDLSDPFVGRLTQISLNPRPSEANANYDVVITTTNRYLRLKPGMTTTIRIMPSGVHLPTKNQVCLRRRHDDSATVLLKAGAHRASGCAREHSIAAIVSRNWSWTHSPGDGRS
ncbi:MAG: HlyD family efflux transporter periplasmic adaptor subunit [Methylocystis silviterrae]|uniref:efflux RND transporter periplasmic adaptor subunit n=1 Tax=Methylocystis silviterrae TaxID=2743612 RepID=UPI003C7912EE